MVIAIIGVLAALILPAIHGARERGRQTDCTNNLRQFCLAWNMYRDDHKDNPPPWLSSLYGRYGIRDTALYICPSDKSDGTHGSKSDSPDYNELWPDREQYEETDDLDTPPVNGCSYLYEFCDAPCSFAGDYAPDLPASATWRETKEYEMRTFPDWGTEVVFPVIRCFHHFRERRFEEVENPASGETQPEHLTINMTYAGSVIRLPELWYGRILSD